MLAAPFSAQRQEVDRQHPFADAQRRHLAMVNLQHRRVVARAARQRLEHALHFGVRRLVQWRVPQMRRGQGAQPVVDAGIDVHHVAVLFNLLNRRQETRALQAVAIEIVWRNVRGRHQRNAACEQRLHQGAEQHGVGNVGDEKLVEAENIGFGFKAVGDDQQRIALSLQLG